MHELADALATFLMVAAVIVLLFAASLVLVGWRLVRRVRRHRAAIEDSLLSARAFAAPSRSARQVARLRRDLRDAQLSLQSTVLAAADIGYPDSELGLAAVAYADAVRDVDLALRRVERGPDSLTRRRTLDLVQRDAANLLAAVSSRPAPAPGSYRVQAVGARVREQLESLSQYDSAYRSLKAV